jgi:hypothetical protein
MGGMNFDFSALSPYITGMANRSMQAMDYRLGQMPTEDRLNRRAYAEWLNNNASKRGIAEGEYRMRRRGFDAAQALGQREERRAAGGRAAAEARKRETLNAQMAYASTNPYNPVRGAAGSPGVLRDFYTYGGYAEGGRGGGGSASGGTNAASGFGAETPWTQSNYQMNWGGPGGLMGDTGRPKPPPAPVNNYYLTPQAAPAGR